MLVELVVQAPSEPSGPRFLQVAQGCAEAMLGSIRISPLAQEGAADRHLAHPVRRVDVERPPVLLFPVRKICAEVSEEHDNLIGSAVVHPQAEGCAGVEVSVLDCVAIRVGVVLVEDLRSEEHGREVVRRIRVPSVVVRQLARVAGVRDGSTLLLEVDDEALELGGIVVRRDPGLLDWGRGNDPLADEARVELVWLEQSSIGAVVGDAPAVLVHPVIDRIEMAKLCSTVPVDAELEGQVQLSGGLVATQESLRDEQVASLPPSGHDAVAELIHGDELVSRRVVVQVEAQPEVLRELDRRGERTVVPAHVDKRDGVFLSDEHPAGLGSAFTVVLGDETKSPGAW